MTTRRMHPETMVLHAAYRQDEATGAVAVPIYQTTSYQFRGTQHAENLFALKELGNIYSRIMNPTCDVLERRFAAIEGGVAGLAVGSGQAASTFAVMNLCQSGDNFVSSTDLYGGTWNLFANTLKGMGVEVRFVDPADPQAFARATDARTRCYYAETLPNPKLQVFPIREVAEIGRSLGVPLIVDNTAAPLICRPLDHGAAVVMYSTTKYIGGHGTSIGGLIIDGGNFDWEAHAERFPLLTQPDPSYHGAVWTEAVKPLGPIAYILRARVILLRDIGGGIQNGKKLKAIHFGAAMGGSLPAELIDTPLDFDVMSKLGAAIGAGGLFVMDEDTNMVSMSRFFLDFLAKESCGKCVPCREGIRQMLQIMTRMSEGKGKEGDIEALEELCEVGSLASLCALGKTTSSPIYSALRYFKKEYEASIKGKGAQPNC